MNISLKAIRKGLNITFAGRLFLLGDEVVRLITPGKGFVVIFCGGSYIDLHLRRTAL